MMSKQAQSMMVFVACLLVALATVPMPTALGQEKPEPAAEVQKLNDGLFAAIGKRDAEAVEELLARGADPNATAGYWGGVKEHWLRTPLIEAARLGEAEIARMLLDAGADPKKCAPLSGFGPIDAALRTYEADSAKILKMLQDAGLDLNAPPPETDVEMSDWHAKHRKGAIEGRLKTRLHQAVAPGRNARRHDPMAAARKTAMLIAAGAPLNNTNGLGQTPLVLLVDEGRFQGRESQLNVLRELLSHKPDLDAQDVDGRTALHHAVIEMDAEVAKILIDAGAKTDIEDEDGRTPVELAQEVYPRHDVLTALGVESEPVPEGTLRPHIHPSRTEGVAPLAVFFDGVATDGLADSDYLNAWFDWEFDTTGVDPDHPRPTGTGFNVAHIFRTPGTYTVKMTVKDTAGKEAEQTLTINVRPFEGKTFHVAADGDDANAGTVDRPWKTVASALERAEPNTRILFRRGDTFESPGVGIAEKKGPVIIGAYTDPKRPSEDAPLIVGQSGVSMRDVHDWRFVDLHWKGLTTRRRAKDSGRTFSTYGVRDLLLMDLEMERHANNVITDVDARNNSDGLFIVDCHMHDAGACGTFISRGARVGFIGNHLQRLHSFEHGYRSQSTKKGYVAYNTFGKDLGVAKTAIQVRGHTEQVVIARNRIANTASFAPANTGVLAFAHHCLADQNIMTSGFTVGAQHITFRRNRMKYEPLEPIPGEPFSNSNASLAGFAAHMDWPGVCEDIHIYGNVFMGDPFVRNPVNNLQVHDNVIILRNSSPSGDEFAGVFHVPFRTEEVHSDRNTYAALNSKTGEALDISEWLKARRAAGQDKDSRLAVPEFISLDPESPDFLIPAPGGTGEGLGAQVLGE